MLLSGLVLRGGSCEFFVNSNRGLGTCKFLLFVVA